MGFRPEEGTKRHAQSVLQDSHHLTVDKTLGREPALERLYRDRCGSVEEVGGTPSAAVTAPKAFDWGCDARTVQELLRPDTLQARPQVRLESDKQGNRGYVAT